MPLFFIFVLVPLIELMLLIEVGAIIGSGWTFVLIIATAIVGTKLVKQQGFHTWRKIQTELSSGQMPAKSLFDGICILISGVTLITPGFITDAIGLLLLTPVFRAVILAQLASRITIRGQHHHFTHQSSHNPNNSTDNDHSRPQSGPATLDGEYTRKDD